MRTLLVLALVLTCTLPALADGPSAVFQTVDLGDGHKMTYQLNPRFSPQQPEYTQFTVEKNEKKIITTMGDPIIVLGGKKVGVWPYKHLTYKFKGGLEITGHADKKDGNIHTMEVYRPDGTMLKITGMDTGKVKVRKFNKYGAWLYKKLRKPTFVLDLSH